MTKHFIALLLIALSFTPPAGAAVASDTIIVMPFENLSGRPEYNWLGEGFAATLSELLDKPGLVAIRSDERNVAYKQEGLPPTAILTRATMIKIAERAGATLVVMGTYRITDQRESDKKEPSPEIKPEENKEVDKQSDQPMDQKPGRTITINARLINIREGRLVGEFNMGGDLLEVQRLQGNLSYELLYKQNQALPFSRDLIVNQASQAPIGAFENYIKGSLTRDRDARIRFLERAIKEFSERTGRNYISAVFELGRVYYEAGDFKDAAKYLSLIDEKDPRYDEAQFYLGVATDKTGETEKALDSQRKLASALPLFEVYNNIGALFIKQKKYADALNHLKPASEAAPRDTDTLFNLGYTYYLSQDYPNAIDTLRREIERRPQDGEAYYILSKALTAKGDQAEATKAADQAKKLLESYAQWETKGAPMIARIKTTFSKANYYRYKRDKEERVESPESAAATPIDQSLEGARNAFFAGRDEEALTILGRILRAAPQNYDAHLLMGRVYERRGDFDRAINALKASVFWNPKLTAAHVLLGRIYVLRNDCDTAQKSLDRALQSDPADQDAQALKRLISEKCKAGSGQ
jgi:tetratricopeptide (TPR) repeat protein